MSSQTAPVAIWDVRHPGSAPTPERGKWLEGQGVAWDTVCSTYRVEFRLADDAPVADLFTYAENEKGQRYMDPATDAPAVNEPFTVPLKSLPPGVLL